MSRTQSRNQTFILHNCIDIIEFWAAEVSFHSEGSEIHCAFFFRRATALNEERVRSP